jgi:hypothetical protein
MSWTIIFELHDLFVAFTNIISFFFIFTIIYFLQIEKLSEIIREPETQLRFIIDAWQQVCYCILCIPILFENTPFFLICRR